MFNNINAAENGERNGVKKLSSLFFPFQPEMRLTLAKRLMIQLRVPLPNDKISKQIYGMNGDEKKRVPESMMVD